VVQVIFQPGAVYQLTGVPATELTNHYLQAEDIFSKQVHLVNEQLFHATSYQAMITIVEAFVLQMINKQQKQQHAIDKVCQLVLYGNEQYSLDWLAKQSFLSTKQFERKFKERTGVNPKLYQRVIRFDNAYRLKNAKPNWDWLRIALAYNYYDYQHLVKDYQNFTNTTPTDFHMVETNAPESILGLNDDYYANTTLRV
jgi:AraC-like DNA-binding protein